MKVGEKVYVKDWGKIYTGSFSIFNWKTKIPDYSTITFHIKTITKPKLTKKGVPYKNGDREFVKRVYEYKSYRYTILEIVQKEDTQVCLIASNEGCYVQIGIDGLIKMNPEDFDKVKHLESELELQTLAFENLGKWTYENATKFPKQLVKYLYDRNQNTLFGSNTTTAIIRYPYIHKDYTVLGNNICLGWEQDFNGKGCDLSDKETITWEELPEMFPENRFI